MQVEADQIEQDEEFWQAVFADLKENGPEVVKQMFREHGDPVAEVIDSYGTEVGALAQMDQLTAAGRTDPLCLNND